jgi:hypothetical protein
VEQYWNTNLIFIQMAQKKKSKIVLYDENDETQRIEIQFKDGVLTYKKITETAVEYQSLNTNTDA